MLKKNPERESRKERKIERGTNHVHSFAVHYNDWQFQLTLWSEVGPPITGPGTETKWPRTQINFTSGHFSKRRVCPPLFGRNERESGPSWRGKSDNAVRSDWRVKTGSFVLREKFVSLVWKKFVSCAWWKSFRNVCEMF